MLKTISRILQRKQAYRHTFLDQDGKPHYNAEIVLADLKRFCRANSSTVVVSPVSKSIDPLAMAMAEGRREVWNRLMAHLYVDEKLIFNLTEDDSKSDDNKDTIAKGV